MKIRNLFIIIALSCALSGCSFHVTDHIQPDTEQNIQLTSPGERLPSVPQEMWNHVLLGTRDAGISATLTDDVLITVIFVDDTSSTWTTEDMEAVKATHATVTNTILEQAASYGADLNLQFEYQQVTLDITLGANDDTPWTEQALSQAGLYSIAEASSSLEKNRGVQEAPILLYSNTNGRSYAILNASNTDSEYAIIFKGDTDGSTCQHELYHLFGAVDYYFPAEIEQLAQTYYSDSVMLGETSEPTTDPLTAYLIGWTDTLSDDALLFLQESSHLTAEYMNSEHEKEIHTGQVQDYQLEAGLYTGNLVMGVQQGWGKMLWDDGSCYEGNWDGGVFNGEGTCTWPSGDIYVGQYEDGDIHGQGTYTWANGDMYIGSWSHEEMHGEGTFTWADGDMYTGSWSHGEMHGKGTYTWADGAIYTGQYQNGLEHGYGTYTDPDGEVYRGYWENGNYVNP